MCCWWTDCAVFFFPLLDHYILENSGMTPCRSYSGLAVGPEKFQRVNSGSQRNTCQPQLVWRSWSRNSRWLGQLLPRCTGTARDIETRMPCFGWCSLPTLGRLLFLRLCFASGDILHVLLFLLVLSHVIVWYILHCYLDGWWGGGGGLIAFCCLFFWHVLWTSFNIQHALGAMLFHQTSNTLLVLPSEHFLLHLTRCEHSHVTSNTSAKFCTRKTTNIQFSTHGKRKNTFPLV